MAVVLALFAALLFALAGAAQQRAASRVLVAAPDGGNRVVRGLRQAVGLARTPLWLAGWSADAAGFAVQAGALHRGSLSVVQPLLVTTMLFSLPLSALGGRRRPRPLDWASAAAACAGLAALCSGERTGATDTVHQARLVAVMVAIAVGAAALVVAARCARMPAVPLSIAAGTLFAVGAAMTKLVFTGIGERGLLGTAGYWPVYGLVVAAATGLVLQQRAFGTGSLPATMTALTITEPLISYVLGMVGFGEHGPHGVHGIGMALAGVALLGAAIAVLARSPLLRQDEEVASERRELSGSADRFAALGRYALRNHAKIDDTQTLRLPAGTADRRLLIAEPAAAGRVS